MNTVREMNEADELNSRLQDQEHRINHMKDCLQEKDQRIKKLEDRWGNIVFCFAVFSTVFVVVGSFFLMLHTIVFIACNGDCGLLDVLHHSKVETYVVLDVVPSAVLFVTLIVSWFLFSCWFFDFWCGKFCDEEDVGCLGGYR